MDANVQRMLFKKAGMLLARRSYSRGELQSILAKVADQAQVEIALKRLESLNLLNDAEYAYNFALGRMRQQGWGPAKVLDALLKRHVEQSTIASAMARIQNEGGEESSLDLCIKKYCTNRGRPSAPKDVKKLVSHLRRRGFDENDIFHALKQAIPGAASQRFETGE
jgi:SOS response regulatory protein OraA/RecX